MDSDYGTILISSVIALASLVLGMVIQWRLAKLQRQHEFVVANFERFSDECREFMEFLHEDGDYASSWSLRRIFQIFSGASWTLLGDDLKKRILSICRDAETEDNEMFARGLLISGEREKLGKLLIYRISCLGETLGGGEI